MFVFSLSRELYGDYIVICILCKHCCLFGRILVYPFFSHSCCCWFTGNEFNVFVSVTFVYRLMLDDITDFADNYFDPRLTNNESGNRKTIEEKYCLNNIVLPDSIATLHINQHIFQNRANSSSAVYSLLLLWLGMIKVTVV